jgi:hypothetical protein
LALGEGGSPLGGGGSGDFPRVPSKKPSKAPSFVSSSSFLISSTIESNFFLSSLELNKLSYVE